MDIALIEPLVKMKVVELPSHREVSSPPQPQLRNSIDLPQINGQLELLSDTVLAGGTGTAANRPTKGLFIGYQYFAKDTSVLSVWTGTAYKTTTLT